MFNKINTWLASEPKEFKFEAMIGSVPERARQAKADVKDAAKQRVVKSVAAKLDMSADELNGQIAAVKQMMDMFKTMQ